MSNRKRNWGNIKRNRCPELYCEKDMALNATFDERTRVLACVCGFRIHESLFVQITVDRTLKGLDALYDSQYQRLP